MFLLHSIDLNLKKSKTLSVIVFIIIETGKPLGPSLDSLLRRLPEVNRCILKRLVLCMRRVQEYSHINKMNADNLSRVFGPNLLRPLPGSKLSLSLSLSLVCVCVSIHSNLHNIVCERAEMCVCVCVCVRERERERESCMG